MKKFAAALALAIALLATSVAGAATGRTSGAAKGIAAPALNWGVADDASKYADDGGSWFYGQLRGANLTENRWTLSFDPTHPTAITELPFFQRAAPVAQAAGIHIVLALYGRPATANDPTVFCTWAAQVATLAKQWGIHDFIVWNEPNTALYWSPQDASAPAKYEALLAQCYDTIHAADSQARVIGFGLSPRSNGPSQTAPIPFIAGVGAAYKASGRTKPIMDQISVHPYPNPNNPTDGPDVGYAATNNYGVPNLDRVKQALYDAFNGTGQPTTVGGLTFRIDELGWQTDTTKYSQYYNQENVAVVSEQKQADYLKTTAEKYFACDATVTDVELFLLADESTRNGRSQDGGTVLGGGWQSGLLTAGGQGVSQPKPAYAQLASDFAAGRGACKGAQVAWSPNGGAGDGGDADGSSNLSGSAGDPDGVVPPDALSDLQELLMRVGERQFALPPIPVNQFSPLFTLYVDAMSQLVQPLTLPQPTIITITLFACDPRSTQCNGNVIANLALARVLSSRAAARPTVLVSAKASVKAGATPKFVIKNAKKKVKLKAGSYAFALVIQNATDPTKKYAVAVKLRSVLQKAVAKPKSKKQAKKKH